MKKMLALFSALVLVCALLGGCGGPDGKEGTTATGGASAGTVPSAQAVYLSYTVTHNAKTKDTFESDVYCYDPASGTSQKVATVPYTAQYPLTAYDRAHGVVYYSSKNKEKNGDELFSYNISTKETKQLTNGIFALSFIFPIGDNVYLGAAPRIAPVLATRPYLYHPDTGKLEDLTWDTDLHFTVMNYNPMEKTIVGAAYSASDEDSRLANQLEVPMEDCTNHMFLMHLDGSHEELLTAEEKVTSLFGESSSLIWCMRGDDYRRCTYQEKAQTSIRLPEPVLETIEKLVYISPDETDYYYLGDGGKGTALFHFNTKTGKRDVIYSADLSYEELNNAVAVAK